MESTAATEVSQVIDYMPMLNEILANASLSADASVLIAGMMLFFVIVVICYFAYKFFRIFF